MTWGKNVQWLCYCSWPSR